MENKNQNTESKNLKKLEEAELTVTLFDKDEVVAASGECSGSSEGNANCLVKGTHIMMADGFAKNIEDIVEGDTLMAFNHEVGCFVGSEVLYAYKGEVAKSAFTCCFANGIKLSIVGTHDLFEQESCRYMTLTEENAEQFVGRHFYSAEEKTYVELVDIVRETEAIDYYGICTKSTFNCIANGMLNVVDDMDYLLNFYEFDKNLKADRKTLAEDIRKYGLFEYNSQYSSSKYAFSKEEYDAMNSRYLNIAIGKGLTSWDALLKQRSEYVDQLSYRSI